MVKVNISDEVRGSMVQNARQRAGWERLGAVAKRYDVEGNRVLDIGTLKDRWYCHYHCSRYIRQGKRTC